MINMTNLTQESINSNIAFSFKYFRENSKIDVDIMANYLGISSEEYKSYEQGEVTPSLFIVFNYAKLNMVSIEKLCSGTVTAENIDLNEEPEDCCNNDNLSEYDTFLQWLIKNCPENEVLKNQFVIKSLSESDFIDCETKKELPINLVYFLDLQLVFFLYHKKKNIKKASDSLLLNKILLLINDLDMNSAESLSIINALNELVSFISNHYTPPSILQ